METENIKRIKKAHKNNKLREALETIRTENSQLYSKVTELLKINSDMIQFVSQPVRKTV
jgi:hypothetical protein